MKILFACGVIAGPLFVASFLVHGVLKPGYDPLRHPVSSLALGPAGWVQTVTFVLCGLLVVAFAVGLATRPGITRKAGAVLLSIWGVGLVGAGVYVTDPVSGYPAGTPALAAEPSPTGLRHDLFSVAAFLALAAACLVLAGGAGRRWALFSVASGAVVLVAFLICGAGFGQNPTLVDVAGLSQRISLIAGWFWIHALALRSLRAPAA